jgi:hypothetical protein
VTTTELIRLLNQAIADANEARDNGWTYAEVEEQLAGEVERIATMLDGQVAS